jgi:hypothetical protein
MHTKRPPRLVGFDYFGFYRYFLTVCTNGRRSWFFNAEMGRSAISSIDEILAALKELEPSKP